MIIGLAIAFAGRYALHRWSTLRQCWPELVAGSAAFLCAGPALIAAGNWQNTGSALHTTYTAVDASGLAWRNSLIAHHLRFYFLSCDSATLVDMSLAIVAVSIITALGSATNRMFRWSTAAATVTTAASILFFLTHEITAPYYLVPSAIFRWLSWQ